MMKKHPSLLLSILSIACHCGATSQTIPSCHALLRIRGGQEMPNIQLQVGKEPFVEGISIIVPEYLASLDHHEYAREHDMTVSSG